MAKEAKTAEALREAQQLMNNSGAHWLQGQWYARTEDGKMGYCSVGAINKTFGSSGTDRDLALVTLAEVIDPDFRDDYDYDEASVASNAEDFIVNWNDTEGRDWEDVKDAFSRARRRLQDRARRQAKKNT